MAITFKKLKYKNFLSVGDTEIEIDLDSIRSTLIVGHNGSGKSLMLDALSFVLFGKPHRSINKPQLVNSINGKGCKVEVEFHIGPSEYRIVRGLKPNIFEIWLNGNLVNQESHSRDYQKLLETNILKLNHKSFHQVVVLGSSNFTPFMQLSTYARREVIEDLLDIGIFSKMNLVLKENQGKLKDTIKDTEYQLNLVKEKIVLQSKHIGNLKSINDSNAAKYDEEISELQAHIDNLVEANSKLADEYGAEYGKSKIKNERDQKTKTSLLSYEKQIKDNIKKIITESKFYETNADCPTCSQAIDKSMRDEKIGECKNKAHDLNEGYERLKTTLAQTVTDLAATEKTLQHLNGLNSTIHSNLKLIGNFEKRISSLLNLKNEQHSDIDIDGAAAELDALKDNRDILSDLKSTQLEERTYNEVIGELLKDTGIKTKVIRQYLPVMNKLINQYLQVLDFFVSFNLDESFTETIRSRHRDDFSYASFSEGEKSRINLALLFAWRQIAKMQNSSNTNLLILDEVFDSSMDNDGVDNLLKIMSSLDDDTRIFVVTHKPDSFESSFDRKITATKKGNFSTYETEMLKS
jgi:DNA repair exonuclease SbcCD ATPase subunit